MNRQKINANFRIFLIIFFFVFLVSCSSSQQTIVSKQIIDKEVIIPEKPPELIMNEIRFEVQNLEILLNKLKENNLITEKQRKEILDNSKKRNNDLFQIVLSKEEFEKLSENLIEIEKYINIQSNIIRYYENINRKNLN
ncbi:MAG: hypothetical protein NZZ41_00615 [Candidatus Dojkabacteria bacterium]|nr:hypothetical protein [Candidatus Dojkabacteria bacterium]